MSVSHQSMTENTFDFRAPPPSPVASGRRSCFNNDEVLSEFLQHSLRVPDLVLPDKVFPKQKFIDNPPKIDFQDLDSMGSEILPMILDSVATIGCFQLVNIGIPGETIRSALSASAGIFQLSPEKRTAVTMSPENLYGFEEIHEDDEGEEFVWCKAKSLELAMEGIWPAGYSNFSEKMGTLVSEIEKVAEKILTIFRESYPQDPNHGTKAMKGHDAVGSACYIYKHGGNISGDKWYDVIKMLIRGIDYSHALCLHICDGSSEFHVYSKKGWVSFRPDDHALVITVGDQIQALSGGELKHVIGRPIHKGEKEDMISMALLYSASSTENKEVESGLGSGSGKGKTISLTQQAIAAIILTLVYHVLVFVYNKF